MDKSYIYLHGFASSPKSAKADFLRDRFREKQIDLQIPDLNQGDFYHLTLTRQLQQIESEFNLKSEQKKVIVGSSFGGLTATWLAQRNPSVERLILLAPAFEFLIHVLPLLGNEKLEKWQLERDLSVYHHGEQRDVLLNYHFIEDLSQYSDEQLNRSLPTLIIHGKQDEIIPIEASRNYTASRPWVKLIEVESDHALGNVLPEIWEAIKLNLDE
ncbi:YqiA/YcfP family alpha/beta fold hydrolase [Capilliphycus salinus ALCB114379]|uniref:YqiA/YcfP family alpha/beta fold hydrolase n=1 Tax=Capilliphycus salinus TaxID=2768948 RepID=UPI0039A5C6D0